MLVIKNGKIITMADRLVDGGDILIDSGKIIDIRSDSSYIPSTSDVVIDAENKFVFPGFIDIHTHCGLDGTKVCDIYNPQKIITPNASVSKCINTSNQIFTDDLKKGITSVMVAPFDNHIIGGKCCVIKTSCNETGEINIVSDFCGEKFSLWSMLYEQTYVYPDNVPRFIKDDLYAAIDYFKPQRYPLTALNSPALEAYRPILQDGAPTFISVFDEEQLKIANGIVSSFSLNGVIMLLSYFEDTLNTELFSNSLSYVFSPINLTPSCRNKLASELNNFNTPFAFCSFQHDICSDILTANAGLMVSAGLDMTYAYNAITTYPAKICNISDRVGSLKEGMDADIVIYDDNPLELMSNLIYTIIDGRIVYSASVGT